MSIILPAIVSEFPGRRLLRIFTSYDRTKIGFEFEQTTTNPNFRYIFDIDGTIDRVDYITDALGHRVTGVVDLELEVTTGQDKFVIYTDSDPDRWALFWLSPAVAFDPVTLTYTTDERRQAPYGSTTEFIVQEDDFNYGPTAGAVPPIASFYILAETGDYLVTEIGDKLLQEEA